jgi:hypothetical protein
VTDEAKAGAKHRVSWQPKVDQIENVEKLRAELQLQSFPHQSCFLYQGYIKIVKEGATKSPGGDYPDFAIPLRWGPFACACIRRYGYRIGKTV